MAKWHIWVSSELFLGTKKLQFGLDLDRWRGLEVKAKKMYQNQYFTCFDLKLKNHLP